MSQAAANTTARVLTAAGRGAIGVIRVSGTDALKTVDSVFRPARGKPLRDTSIGAPRVGRIGAGSGDEVVAVIVAESPPRVEIQCHGGSASIGLVLAAIQAESVRVGPNEESGPGETIDTLAEALDDLPHAPTLRTAAILLEQAQGALDFELRQVIAALSHDPDQARRDLEKLRERAGVGLRLRDGWRVALAGRPNVGKSSLLNAILGFDRAIVNPCPGTTRDVVRVQAACDGWPVEFADTAGIRAAIDVIEQSGVERARRVHDEADLVALLLDGSVPLTAADHDLIAEYPQAFRIATKADLPLAWKPSDWHAESVSARQREGIDSLLSTMLERLIGVPIPKGVGVPFRPSHRAAIDAALGHLANRDFEASRLALLPFLSSAQECSRHDPVLTD